MLDGVIEKIKFYISLGRDAMVWQVVVNYMETVAEPLEDRQKALSYLLDNEQTMIFICVMYQLESSRIDEVSNIAKNFYKAHQMKLDEFRDEMASFIDILESTVKTINETHKIIDETAKLKKDKDKLQKEADDLQNLIDDLKEDEDQ